MFDHLESPHPHILYDLQPDTGRPPCDRSGRIAYWQDMAEAEPDKFPASLLMAWFNNDFGDDLLGESWQARDIIGQICAGGGDLTGYLLEAGRDNISASGGIWRGFTSWVGGVSLEEAIRTCRHCWSSWSTDRTTAEGLANNSGILLHAVEGPFYAICELASCLPPNCGQVEREHILPPCSLVLMESHDDPGSGFTVAEVAVVAC